MKVKFGGREISGHIPFSGPKDERGQRLPATFKERFERGILPLKGKPADPPPVEGDEPEEANANQPNPRPTEQRRTPLPRAAQGMARQGYDVDGLAVPLAPQKGLPNVPASNVCQGGYANSSTRLATAPRVPKDQRQALIVEVKAGKNITRRLQRLDEHVLHGALGSLLREPNAARYDAACAQIVAALVGSDLLSEPFNPSPTSSSPLLFLAARAGSILTATALLNIPSINVNAANGRGETALHAAVANADGLALPQLLLDRGAKVGTASRRTPVETAGNGTTFLVGATALHIAACKGDADLMGLLLENCEFGDVNRTAEASGPTDPGRIKGVTALHLAAGFGDTNLVRALLRQKDIDVLAEEGNGKTALDRAQAGNHDRAVRRLRHAMDRVKSQAGPSRDSLLPQEVARTLGVEPDATLAQIGSAFKKKVLRLHPDKTGGIETKEYQELVDAREKAMALRNG